MSIRSTTTVFRTKTKIEPCLGVPVVYHPKAKMISDSRGLWRWKRIVVGPVFFALPKREQAAILAHEAGHCKMKHLEQRIAKLWLLLVSPERLRELCREQEFQADRFAAACGYGEDLVRVFRRVSDSPHPLHPPISERISRLLALA